MALKVKRPDGTWVEIGTADRPFKLKHPDGTWHTYAGSLTGAPVKQKQLDGTWVVVAREGEYVNPTVDVTVNLTVLDGDGNGIPNARVIIGGEDGERFTDSTGHLTWTFTSSPDSGKGVRSYKSAYEYKETVIYPNADNTVFNITHNYAWRTASIYPDPEYYFPFGASATHSWGDYVRPDSDYVGQFGPWNSTTSGESGYGNNFDAFRSITSESISTTGYPPAPEFIYDWLGNRLMVQWFALPIRLFHEMYLAQRDLNYPGAQLQSVTITMRLYGFSVRKRAMEGWAHYNYADTNDPVAPLLDGAGRLYYQGASSDTTASFDWQLGQTVHTSTIGKVLRSSPTMETSGTLLHSGQLNAMGCRGAHGFYRDPITITQNIPLSLLDEPALIYTAHMDEVPYLTVPSSVGNGFHNVISVDFQPTFTFRY